jgi:hypothetical protein
MGANKKQIIYGFEIIYNSLGQVMLKKRFLNKQTLSYYRYILGGL